MKRENFERAKALIGRAKDVEDLIKSIRENGVLFFVPDIDIYPVADYLSDDERECIEKARQSLVEILHDAAVRQLDGINNEIAQL